MLSEKTWTHFLLRDWSDCVSADKRLLSMFSGATEAAAVDVTGGHRAYGSIVRRVPGLVLVFHFPSTLCSCFVLFGLPPVLLVLQFLFGS